LLVEQVETVLLVPDMVVAVVLADTVVLYLVNRLVETLVPNRFWLLLLEQTIL
jgi:hypothetical protein